MNEQLYTREDMKQGFLHSMAGDDWLMSDFDVKFEDKHKAAFDFKVVELGVLHQNMMAGVRKDGLLFRLISYFEPL